MFTAVLYICMHFTFDSGQQCKQLFNVVYCSIYRKCTLQLLKKNNVFIGMFFNALNLFTYISYICYH